MKIEKTNIQKKKNEKRSAKKHFVNSKFKIEKKKQIPNCLCEIENMVLMVRLG